MSERRRLLRLITRLNIGGPARQALLLSRRMTPEFTTTLAAGVPSTEEGELLDDAVPVVRVPLRRELDPRADPKALVAVRSLLRRERPAIVHTHMAKAGTIGRLAALSLGRNRPRLVHTFHGHVLEGYFSPAKTAAFVRAERALARRTDALVAVSDEVRDSLLDLGIGTPDRLRVIPLGFDLRPHRAVAGRGGALRERLGLDDEPLVGMVGRLAPIKDHETMLRAIATVPDAHLAVLGDGPSRAEVEWLVAELGLQRRVHLIGWWHDIPAAMADVDLVALSSRNEGTPVALIEAAACGRPVVATDVGGVRSVVEDGETGLLVPAGDSTALAAAMERLLRDRAMADRFGAAGRAGSHRFDEDRLVADVRALYAELLAGPLAD